MTFQEEFVALLRKHRIPYDARDLSGLYTQRRPYRDFGSTPAVTRSIDSAVPTGTSEAMLGLSGVTPGTKKAGGSGPPERLEQTLRDFLWVMV